MRYLFSYVYLFDRINFVSNLYKSITCGRYAYLGVLSIKNIQVSKNISLDNSNLKIKLYN